MRMPTLIPGSEEDDQLNPAHNNYESRFNKYDTKTPLQQKKQSNEPSQGDIEDGLKKLEDHANGGAEKQSETVGERESSGDIRSTFTGKNNKFTGTIKTASRAKKLLPLFGLGGFVAIAGFAILAMLPLKLNMYVANITKYASEVPGYAIGQRSEYVFTRLLATHLLRQASGLEPTDADAKAKMVFCKGASISCSLISTYGADYFDKIISTSLDATGRTITITPEGRDSLGGKARSWTIQIDKDLGDDQLLKTMKNIENNADAKKFLKGIVNSNLKTKSFATRYLARMILMKKYGITHWRAFEKTSNKIAETKTKIRASVMKNTVGKVSSKMSVYLGCFTDEALCQKLKDGIDTKSSKIQDEIDEKIKKGADPESDEIKRLKSQKEALDKITGKDTSLNDGDISDPEAGGSGKRILLKKLMTILGAAAIIGSIDMAFKAVGAIDNGVLEQISADMTKVAYIGFGMGDDTGIIPNAEKLMAGDIDMESYGELVSLFDGAESSPLFAMTMGLTSEDEVNQTSYTRQCDEGGEIKSVALEKGQLICPDRRVARDYTSWATSNPAWQTLAAVADVWNNSIGLIIGAVTSFVGDLPIISQIGQLVSSLTEPLMNWVLGLFFAPPPTGFDTTGDNNFDSLFASMDITQNELAENGVTADGKAYGIGGALLSNSDVAMVRNTIREDDAADFEQQSMVAKIFDTNLKGSFAQQLLARIPSTAGGFFNLPATSFSYAFSSLTTNTHAASSSSPNPFNIPKYGYLPGDPALTADPGQYDEATCAALAKAREDSYGAIEGYRVPGYTKSDPCALEKAVVGTMLAAQGVTNDPYSLIDPSKGVGGSSTPASPSGVQGRPDNAADWGDGWSLADGQDYSSVMCPSSTKDMGVISTGQGGAKIRACELPSGFGNPGAENGGGTLSSLIAGNAMSMLEAAHAAGLDISLYDGMRNSFSGGYRSEHARGVAMDLRIGGSTICYNPNDFVNGWGSLEGSEAACSSIGGEQYRAYKWLQENAGKYGFLNYVKEPWHWSTSGR